MRGETREKRVGRIDSTAIAWVDCEDGEMVTVDRCGDGRGQSLRQGAGQEHEGAGYLLAVL